MGGFGTFSISSKTNPMQRIYRGEESRMYRITNLGPDELNVIVPNGRDDLAPNNTIDVEAEAINLELRDTQSEARGLFEAL